MSDEKLSELLRALADDSPESDLVPDALRGVRRRRLAQGALAAATAIPVLAVIAALMAANQPTIHATIAPLAPMGTTSFTPTTTVPTHTSSPTRTPRPTSPPTTSTPKPVTPSKSTPSAAPSPPPASTDQYEIPVSVRLTASEIPKGIQVDSPQGMVTADMTHAYGFACDPGTPGAARPVAGRWWSYANYKAATDGESLKTPSIELIVTGWEDGALALDEISRDKGY